MNEDIAFTIFQLYAYDVVLSKTVQGGNFLSYWMNLHCRSVIVLAIYEFNLIYSFTHLNWMAELHLGFKLQMVS